MSALDKMSRRDLQRKAKEYGVKANSSSDLIRRELQARGFDLGPRRRRPAQGREHQAERCENESQSMNSATRDLSAELRCASNPVERGRECDNATDSSSDGGDLKDHLPGSDSGSTDKIPSIANTAVLESATALASADSPISMSRAGSSHVQDTLDQQMARCALADSQRGPPLPLHLTPHHPSHVPPPPPHLSATPKHSDTPLSASGIPHATRPGSARSQRSASSGGVPHHMLATIDIPRLSLASAIVGRRRSSGGSTFHSWHTRTSSASPARDHPGRAAPPDQQSAALDTTSQSFFDAESDGGGGDHRGAFASLTSERGLGFTVGRAPVLATAARSEHRSAAALSGRRGAAAEARLRSGVGTPTARQARGPRSMPTQRLRPQNAAAPERGRSTTPPPAPPRRQTRAAAAGAAPHSAHADASAQPNHHQQQQQQPATPTRRAPAQAPARSPAPVAARRPATPSRVPASPSHRTPGHAAPAPARHAPRAAHAPAFGAAEAALRSPSYTAYAPSPVDITGTLASPSTPGGAASSHAVKRTIGLENTPDSDRYVLRSRSRGASPARPPSASPAQAPRSPAPAASAIPHAAPPQPPRRVTAQAPETARSKMAAAFQRTSSRLARAASLRQSPPLQPVAAKPRVTAPKGGVSTGLGAWAGSQISRATQKLIETKGVPFSFHRAKEGITLPMVPSENSVASGVRLPTPQAVMQTPRDAPPRYGGRAAAPPRPRPPKSPAARRGAGPRAGLGAPRRRRGARAAAPPRPRPPKSPAARRLSGTPASLRSHDAGGGQSWCVREATAPPPVQPPPQPAAPPPPQPVQPTPQLVEPDCDQAPAEAPFETPSHAAARRGGNTPSETPTSLSRGRTFAYEHSTTEEVPASLSAWQSGLRGGHASQPLPPPPPPPPAAHTDDDSAFAFPPCAAQRAATHRGASQPLPCLSPAGADAASGPLPRWNSNTDVLPPDPASGSTFPAAKPQLAAPPRSPAPSIPRQPPSVGRSRGRRGAGSGGSAPRGSRTPTGVTPPCEDTEFASCLDAVRSEVLVTTPGVSWADIAGLAATKQVLQEAVVLPSLRPDIFTGLRAPSRGVLLFGPPGTGKTMLAKAVATEARATFFAMSASSLTSRYVGRAEKMVRALFAVARASRPAIIFIDEIDSVLSARSSGEHEASRRLKTEFLLHMDGVATHAPSADGVIVIGATNRPADLDEGVLRRLERRVYVPLPDATTRGALLRVVLASHATSLTDEDVAAIAGLTEGCSGSDIASLCKEAAMRPIRELRPEQLATVAAASLRPLARDDFEKAAAVVKASVPAATLRAFEAWNAKFGIHMGSLA